MGHSALPHRMIPFAYFLPFDSESIFLLIDSELLQWVFLASANLGNSDLALLFGPCKK